jgi:uncharacterized Zn-binding protein involved in type VI secretion
MVMSLTAEQLFALLPAVYRTRDAANGGPLQALFAVIAEQSTIVQENILRLYDDQFIETCSQWVIPYIGDLIGYNSVYEIASATVSSRAEVANTIGYRRRKGTQLALEQVAMDVSGRTAKVVEFFKWLITTESMRDVRPQHGSTVNLRCIGALDRFDTPFDRESRTIDVRRIAPRVRNVSDPDPAPLEIALHGAGRFNIPDIGIYLWRWKSFAVTNAPAFPVGGGRYLFSPLGQNMPLFSRPAIRSSFSSLTTRADVPEPIDRYEFRKQLNAFYGSGKSVALVADGTPIDVSQIVCANLADQPGGEWCNVTSGKIAIDPELGRIQFAADLPLPESLRLTYAYGFPAEIGGGPYDRSPNLQLPPPAQANFYAVVGSVPTPTLEAAVAQWNARGAGTIGLIILPDFESFSIDLTGANAIQLPPQSQLSIVAAQTHPAIASTDISYNDACVTLTGDIEVSGVAGPPPTDATASAGQLLLSGVWIAGQLRIAGETSIVQLADCTLVPGLGLTRAGDPIAPGDPSIIVTAVEASLSLVRVIAGPVAAVDGGSTRICSSIIDATSPCCIAYAGSDLAAVGADLHIEDSTVIGKVRTRTMLLASNTIFCARRGRRDPWAAALWCSRRQTGCMRFCFVPSDAITPQRYECLPPDPASEAALDPKFITLRFGQPSYALLSGDVPLAIWQGADNGSQIGVYNAIQETEAVRNVQLRAPEYLPFGLESGVFLIPSQPLLRAAPAPVVGYGLQSRKHCCDHSGVEEQVVGIGIQLM